MKQDALTHGCDCLLLNKDISVIDQEELEKEIANLFGVAL